MLDPGNKDSNDLPLTIRAVFIIGPDKKLKLSLNYPASVGRNMDEIVRCIDALQLSAKHSVVSSHSSVCFAGHALQTQAHACFCCLVLMHWFGEAVYSVYVSYGTLSDALTCAV